MAMLLSPKSLKGQGTMDEEGYHDICKDQGHICAKEESSSSDPPLRDPEPYLEPHCPTSSNTTAEESTEDAEMELTSAINKLKSGIRWEVKEILSFLCDLSSEKKYKFVLQGGLLVLVDHLKTKRLNTAGVVELLVSLLELGEDIQALFIQKGGVKLIVKCLRSKWSKTRWEALRAAPLIASTRPGRHELQTMGAVGILLKIFRLPNPPVRDLAAIALATIAQDLEARKEILESKGLDFFVLEMQKEKPESMYSAACTIAETLCLGVGTAVGNLKKHQIETIVRRLHAQWGRDTCKEIARIVSFITSTPDGISAVLEVRGQDCLLNLLDLGNTESEYWALKALGNIVSSGKAGEMVVPLIPNLHQVLVVGNLDCRQESLRCLLYAADEHPCHKYFEPCISCIIELLYQDQSECLELAIALISKLLMHGNHVASAAPDGILALIKLLHYESNNVQEAAARALANVAVNKECAAIIFQKGGYRPLAALIENGQHEKELWALKCLTLMAFLPTSHVLLKESNLMSKLTNLLRKRNDRIRMLSMMFLKSTAECGENQAFAVSPALCRAVTAILQSNNTQLKQLSLSVLSILGRMDLFQGSWMLIAQVVLPMIDEGNYVIQQHVASILADLATTEGDVAQFLRETGPKLCQLVQSHNFQVAQQAVRALTNFALHSILDRESIRQSISSGKLTCFLNEGNPAVKVTAAHCIEVIAEQSTNYKRQAILDGALLPLVNMIEHEDRECRVKGACAIATLVEDIDASVHAMFTAGGVRPLVSLLLNGDEECTLPAALTIASMVHDRPSIQRAFIAAGIEPCLIRMLRNQDTQTRMYAARIFADLKEPRRGNYHYWKQTVILLINLLSEKDIDCLQHTLSALANSTCTAHYPDALRFMFDVGALPHLIRLITHGGPAVQETAVRAISCLAADENIAQAVAKEGGLPSLIQLLSSDVEETRVHAISAIASTVSRDNSYSNQVAESGAMLIISSMLRDGTPTCQEQIVSILEVVASTSGCEVHLIETSIVCEMIGFLKDAGGRVSLKQRAIKAMICIANASEDAQLMMLNGGVVDPLLWLSKATDSSLQSHATCLLSFILTGCDEVVNEYSSIQAMRRKCIQNMLGSSHVTLPEGSQQKKQTDARKPPIPPQFVCPITYETLTDPVVAADGYTYERSAIVEWFRRKNSSPMTNLELRTTEVIPNIFVASMLEEFKARND